MTYSEIHTYLAARGKPVSDPQLYRYMRRLNIRPVGEGLTCPRLYPEDAGRVIADWLGLPVIVAGGVEHEARAASSKLVSLPRLQRARRSGRKARAAR